MGSYANVAILNGVQEEVAAVLREMKRTAFVAPRIGTAVAVADRELEDPVLDKLNGFAAELTKRLAQACLASGVYDDDVVYLGLFRPEKKPLAYVWTRWPDTEVDMDCASPAEFLKAFASTGALATPLTQAKGRFEHAASYEGAPVGYFPGSIKHCGFLETLCGEGMGMLYCLSYSDMKDDTHQMMVEWIENEGRFIHVQAAKKRFP
jgi:hypothetical protein